MQVGLAIPNAHETLADAEILLDLARRAEARGFASLWLNDHVVVPIDEVHDEAADRQPQYLDRRRQRILEPIVLLAYLAAATRHVRLGTSVYVLALRNAVVAAKQIATLDNVSGGRVTLGVGVGWREREFDAVGVPFRERGARTTEALKVLKSVWTMDSPEFHGRHYSFSGIECSPRPLQQPHPPLWIGGRTGVGARRAAELGDAWHPSHFTRSEIAEWAPRLARLCEAAGRPAGAVEITTRRRLIPLRPPTEEPDARRTLQGAPEEIAEDLLGLEAAGVTHIVVEPEAKTRSEFAEAVDWTGSEVLPLLASQRTTSA